MTYFAWVKSRSWSGHLTAQKSAGKPWDPETNLSKSFSPVVFERKLDDTEDGLTLDQLIAKYPKPE